MYYFGTLIRESLAEIEKIQEASAVQKFFVSNKPILMHLITVKHRLKYLALLPYKVKPTDAHEQS